MSTATTPAVTPRLTSSGPQLISVGATRSGSILTVPDDDQVVFMTADPDTRPRALRHPATRAA